MNVIILTGNEIRHKYFRLFISNFPNINVISSFCETNEQSLENKVKENPNSSRLEKLHVNARTQSEKDFFQEGINNLHDHSNPILIKKGNINSNEIVSKIINSKPDLLVCYGSSLIKSKLINIFDRKFINVHLGLSPYYRGSGTNVWPLINGEPEMVGATFMYLDKGIDKGQIIHQIGADFYIGDSPHTIGNRLIKKMTQVYAELIVKFNQIENIKQPDVQGLFYLHKDFNGEACRKLYNQFNNGIIEKFLNSERTQNHILTNPGICK